MNIDRAYSDMEERLSEMDFGRDAILDISVYPLLHRIDSDLALYFPDTLKDLLLAARERPQYYFHIARLFMKWTRRYIDVESLEEVIFERRIQSIGITNERIHSFCYENFVSKDLVVELLPKYNPRINLVGDIVGKILGFAASHGAPILMANRSLVRITKSSIPILDTANAFVHRKQRFFDEHLPFLRKTKGVRWVIGITVGAAVSPIGLALALIDP